jgi:hypothetical protein
VAVLFDNDESGDGYLAAMEIDQNYRILDSAQHHFNFTCLGFKTFNFFIQILILKPGE